MPSMGCQKLTYQNLETQLKVVYKKRLLNEKVVQLWLSVDPLASKFPNMSPYMYVRGNPIMFIDKWGLEAETNGKIKVKKVKSDKDGKSRFSFKNKATGENGYIYAPKGTSRRTLRKNMNNKKYKNLNILTWNKKGDFKEDNYNSDGLKIYNLSAVAIQGKIPIPGLRLNHKQTQNLLIGRQNVANDLSFWTGRGAFFGLTFLKTNPLTGIAITTGGEFMAAYTFLDSKISGAILSKYINMSDNNGNPAPREGITIQTFNNSSNYNPGSQGAIIFDTNTGKRLGYYPNY